jgi:hypothetical protein
MPTNFQNASNQLRSRVNDQFQGPPVALPPQAVGPNIAPPDVVAPPPAAVVPPPVATPIDPGGIVPVNDRDARRLARRAAGHTRRAANWAEEGLNPLNVVPVNRGNMQDVMDQLRNTRRGQAVREALGTKRGRQAIATVGGAVMGRAARAQARQEKMAEYEAARAAGQSMFENRPRGTPLSNNPALPVAAAGPAPGAIAAELPRWNPVAAQVPVAPVAPAAPSQIDMQQRLQDFISQRNLPEAMGSRITTAAQTMDPTRLAGLLSRYGR